MALAQLARNEDPRLGYEPLLDDLVGPVLGDCQRHGIAIVSNFGAANPQGAARRIAELAARQGLAAPRIAVVHGDALDAPEQRDLLRQRLGGALDGLDVVSATAYLGAAEIAQALVAGAQIVVAGRVADPSLTLGPALAHFGWDAADWPRLGRATIAGHMLECGLQVTGGYFSVPGGRTCPICTKPASHRRDPVRWGVRHQQGRRHRRHGRCPHGQGTAAVRSPRSRPLSDAGRDRRPEPGPRGRAGRRPRGGARRHRSCRPDELKVNVCYRGGWLAEAEISYAGVQAEARARQAADIVRRRLGAALRLRADLIGVVSVLGDDGGDMLAGLPEGRARDVRLRLAATHAERAQAERLLREVTALYTCGPAGGGGVRTALRPRLNMMSCTIPRDAVRAGWRFLEEIPQ